MSELVANCPRCKSQQMTFDLVQVLPTVEHHGWQKNWEAFCICRNCFRSTIFVLQQKSYDDCDYLRKKSLPELDSSVNQVAIVKGHVSQKDEIAEQPPEHLPENINSIFIEGAACMAIGCHNAGATMFRLCIDLATSSMLPVENENGLNNRIRRSLGLRLEWLFEKNILPAALQDLSTCIKEDGNDGAHTGNLSEEDAADILDFTYMLLERLYTEPQRLEMAKIRRQARRESKDGA
ncbi:hypothetical protein A28LD_1191 [Idiomarina sp. A28L]|uniref:DUF4145 domain-containing protein n=1 Tax=Idiomarina sp. A28L TaxID=1036674 RepID=UPI0002138E5C|nr:DUF4145 domain-containing protein [Idiomarina sp. A28L]EGN75176.1 hypothetical protein A28LD_1191 [Idiomarina sp. A28L]